MWRAFFIVEGLFLIPQIRGGYMARFFWEILFLTCHLYPFKRRPSKIKNASQMLSNKFVESKRGLPRICRIKKRPPIMKMRATIKNRPTKRQSIWIHSSPSLARILFGAMNRQKVTCLLTYFAWGAQARRKPAIPLDSAPTKQVFL